MEEKALIVLKNVLISRGLKGEFETVGNPMDETKMYTFNSVLIIFSEKTRVTERELINFMTFASENNYNNGIVVIGLQNASDSVLRVVREHISNRENPLIQIFDIHHLQFDITKHQKVPVHRIIKDEEKQRIIKEFNITNPRDVLPWIDSQDPMAKWIGARPDDIIEVKRISESAAIELFYRYCVADCHDD